MSAASSVNVLSRSSSIDSIPLSGIKTSKASLNSLLSLATLPLRR
jgi:hypothetical protein